MNKLIPKLQTSFIELKEGIINFLKPHRVNAEIVEGSAAKEKSSILYMNFNDENKSYPIEPGLHIKTKDCMIQKAIADCLKEMRPLHAEILYYKTFEKMDTSSICKKYDIETKRFWQIIHQSRNEMNAYLIERELI